jgi:hypothetical protein
LTLLLVGLLILERWIHVSVDRSDERRRLKFDESLGSSGEVLEHERAILAEDNRC